MTIASDEVNGLIAFNQTLMANGNPVQQRIVNDLKNVSLLWKIDIDLKAVNQIISNALKRH